MGKKLAIVEMVAFLAAVGAFTVTALQGSALIAGIMGVVLGGLGAAVVQRVLRDARR